MTQIIVEVVGYTYRPCGPFPCELDECYQKELVALDKEIPDRIKEIVRAEHPPLPIILINGACVPVGAVSVPRITEYIDPLL